LTPAGDRRRVRRRLLIALGVIVFLVLSALLARFLTSDNLEREDDVALIEAEARGDSAGVIAKLSGCRENPSCVELQQKNASNPRMRRAGGVKVLSLTSATANSPTGATGKTRVAWTVLGQLPVVQCIEVKRSGNALTGVHVALLSLSAPINNEADC
jgi:hypothetical protein